MSVPLSGLLNPAFAAERRCLIGTTAGTSPVAPGNLFAPLTSCPSSTQTQASSASPEPDQTNNIVTTDRYGDIVAYTNTINFFGGSGQAVPDYGFLLNDELTDFDFAPPSPGAPDPNLPADNKQPRSSMGPIIALKDGKPQFEIGAAGWLDDHLNGGADADQPRRLRDVAIRCAERAAGGPDEFGHLNRRAAFYNSALAHQLTSQYGEQFTLATGPIQPLDSYPGDATALQVLPGGSAEAIAAAYRLGGGSALAIGSSTQFNHRHRGTHEHNQLAHYRK